jgi:ABC-type glucose/galactose transport system permease subunit
MAPHFIAPLIIIPILVWRVWNRVRSQFGLQPIRRKQMVTRVVVFAIVGALVAFYALSLRNSDLLIGLGAGVLVGAAIGLIGLNLTRFQIDPVKGDCYVPNPYIGAFLTILFIGRIVWRLAMVSPQLMDSSGNAQPVHGPDIGQSPLTLGIFGLIVGYYICYFAGLLIHHRRILRERPGQMET